MSRDLYRLLGATERDHVFELSPFHHELQLSLRNCEWQHIVQSLAMLSSTRARGLERAIASSTSTSIPSFLLPAFQNVPARSFAATCSRESHIGKAPLSIPPEVNFIITEPQNMKNGRRETVTALPTVSVEGPLGTEPAVTFY
jgi:hypothetical protein